ncbi:hypothetical protein LTR70_008161 [Exophiala xenobiotica]|uniref:MJ1316 RNA cyclic group end recognition domain-containing protein n=1 Tax=Lithohypha guttulata TaxID=1690604 RepID=A0ABR0K2J2_9EURO|nr:hypothetical protein LTR24_007748 [Lithohypha guttulata]KAK5312480.1 hypothetical protein LTR70_008161 [Exophiala xenobiotica]
MANQTQTDRLAQLRALAQNHLTEIEVEKAQEQAHLTQAVADIQRYAKMPAFDRKKQVSGTTAVEAQELQAATDSPLESNKQRFRPFQEILHRLKWDPMFDVEDYVVGYLERFEGIKEMPATSWIRDFSDEEWVPMHRVRYVKRVQKSTNAASADGGPDLGMVWDRDERLDRISRSTEAGSDDVDSRTDVLSMDGTSVTGGMAL